jgi:phage terminase large subunit GpA-like protein
MLELGEWKAHNPGHQTVGFFLNSLYSPLGWLSWLEIAQEYYKAKKELEDLKKSAKLKTFTNTILGKVWSEPGESPEWQRIYLRREKYDIGTVPNGVKFLTCAADVQKDRIECEVVGWASDKQSWSIDYQVFEGNPIEDAVWDELEEYLGTMFPMADGSGAMPIRMTAVDSGYLTQRVYNFVRRFPPNRVVAIKGNETQGVYVSQPKITDVKVNAKIRKRRAAKVWSVGTTLIKDELYAWLKLDPPVDGAKTKSGYCHFPEYAEEYFRQLTAEKAVYKTDKKGNSSREYVKDRERNEALDIRVYNRAAASLVGIDRLRPKQLEAMTQKAPVAKPEEVSHSDLEAPIKPKRKRERRARRRRGPSEIW